MKQINYTGSSKLISRIVSLLNRKAPLPLDGDGNPDWGTNGQMLVTDGTGSTNWVTPPAAQVQSDWNVADSTKADYIKNKPSDATQSTHGLMSSADKTKLDGIASGAEVNVQSDWNEANSTSDAYIANKPTIPAAQIQSDWTQSDNTQADYIKNKPTIPTVNDATLTITQNGSSLGTFTANASANVTIEVPGGGGGSTYTAGDGIDISAQNEISVDTTFTEASTRANIASGDSLATIWGKIKKFFADLKTVAFTGAYSDLTGTPTIPTKTSQLTNDSGYLTSAAPTSGSAAYVRVANPDPVSGGSASITFNDLAKKFFAMGMINAATDNPLGSAKWAHGISMAWGDNNNSSWISQIAIGTQNGTGMYYRTNGSGSIVGKAWTRLIDSSNISSQSVAYATNAALANNATKASVTTAVARSADTNYPMYFWWSGKSGQPQWLWGGDDGTNMYVYNPSNFSVNFATSARGLVSADGTTTINVQSASVSTELRLQWDSNLVLYKSGTAVWATGTSSKRFKHNIKDMTEERARKILEIRAVIFDWNDDQVVTTQKEDNAGVIAEEVSQIIPDVVVFEDLDDERVERRVEYERFTPYLIKMVQMQQAQIDALSKRIEELEGKV